MGKLSALKGIARSLVVDPLERSFGIRISRAVKDPFDYVSRLPRFQEVSVELFGHKFIVPDGFSFHYTFKEIFVDRIYEFASPDLSPTVIDCGANIGLSIIYFKQLYPMAQITAVEGDPKIFQILQRNLLTRGITDVDSRNCVVSGKRTAVDFYSDGADGGRIHVLNNPKAVQRVDSVMLDDLICGETQFLKIDIEGAETDAILGSSKLHLVQCMFVEYHSFVDSPQSLGSLLEKLTAVGFRYYIRSEFCSPRPLVEKRSNLGMDLQLNIFACRGEM